MRRIGAISLGVLLVLTGVVVMNAKAGAVTPGFTITTNPPLVPAFSPTVSDYAVACTGSSSTSITTTGSGRVRIGASSFSGPVNVSVPLVANQEVQVKEGGSSYYIRCLPSDFPTYSAAVTGTPQASGYLVSFFGLSGGYSVVFDNQGVPVWWDKDPDPYSPMDAKFLSPTTIAWSDDQSTYQIHNLKGMLKHTVGGGSTPLDYHDMQQLPNGNYLGITDRTTNCPAVPSQCVDLSSWGLSAQSSILDAVIVELNRQNKVVWQWSVADHIDVATANVNWHDAYPDVIHMNSIEYDGNGGIIWSARHLDAIYRIDMATGDITWKLGGSPTPQSLKVVGDQYVSAGGQLFSGQHDARLLPDGSMTVHDNGTRAGRAPRGLRFTIDTSTNTATEVEQITDPRAPSSFYTGSVQKLPGGDWVADWGGNDFVTELNSQGVPQITITYPGRISYRCAEVTASLSALRRGMNAMVPSATAVTMLSSANPTVAQHRRAASSKLKT